MTPRQCVIAAESFTASLLAQAGYDVLVQYGANQPHYDLVAVKDKRILLVSVKGSQDGGWMLASRYVKEGVNYHQAIDQWLTSQRDDIVFILVQFQGVSIGQAPASMLPAQLKLPSNCDLTETAKVMAHYKKTCGAITQNQVTQTTPLNLGYSHMSASTAFSPNKALHRKNPPSLRYGGFSGELER